MQKKRSLLAFIFLAALLTFSGFLAPAAVAKQKGRIIQTRITGVRTILAKIDRKTGRVKKFKMLQSTGNAELDQAIRSRIPQTSLPAWRLPAHGARPHGLHSHALESPPSFRQQIDARWTSANQRTRPAHDLGTHPHPACEPAPPAPEVVAR